MKFTLMAEPGSQIANRTSQIKNLGWFPFLVKQSGVIKYHYDYNLITCFLKL